jgi:phosphate transport system protein
MAERISLDNKINYLLDEIKIMDTMVENATKEAVNSLKNRNLDLARRIISYDEVINSKRIDLEKETIIMIATTQPVVAKDLRLVASIIDIISELERIGDYAKYIARIAIKLGDEPPVKPLIDIPRMADLAINMLNRAIEAFVSMDAETAKEIPKEDDRVDFLYNQVYRELVTYMLTDPATIDRANLLMWAAHNLERMADRVANICERTVFVVTGEYVELSPSGDNSKEMANIA